MTVKFMNPGKPGIFHQPAFTAADKALMDWAAMPEIMKQRFDGPDLDTLACFVDMALVRFEQEFGRIG